MLNLRQIRNRIDKLAKIVGAEPDDLPSYGSSRDFGYPHIEVDESSYHWVVIERGRELKHLTFSDLDDLLFTVFISATWSIASRWELAHRIPNQDTRRLLFQRQLELLLRLDPVWSKRRRKQIDAILIEHPFRDTLP